MTVTVEEALAKSKTLAQAIQVLVREYEAETECFVHSIPVTQRSPNILATVDVKVQITPPRG